MMWRAGILVLSLVMPAVPAVGEQSYSEQRVPCVEHDPLKRPFFGDLHVHTRYSLDASTQGTRTTPAQAYGFARGERIGIQPWTQPRAMTARAARARPRLKVCLRARESILPATSR